MSHRACDAEMKKLMDRVVALTKANEELMEVIESCGAANREFQEREKAFEERIEELEAEVYLIEPKCVSESEGEFGITYKEAFEAERKVTAELRKAIDRIKGGQNVQEKE